MPAKASSCPKCGQLIPKGSTSCLFCEVAGDGAPGAAGASGWEENRVLGAKPKFRAQTDPRAHYLIACACDPVELVPGKLFSIGRDSRASFHVGRPEVSRQHAEIVWDGDRPTISEVRSRFGTYLNGHQVRRGAPEALQHGDEIGLGGAGFTIVYCRIEPRALQQVLEGDGAAETADWSSIVPSLREQVGGAHETAAPPRGTGRAEAEPADAEVVADDDLPLQGDLSVYRPKHVLGALYRLKVTGVLTIHGQTGAGEVILVEGKAKRVALGAFVGGSAVEQILQLRQGFYSFRPGEPGDMAALGDSRDRDVSATSSGTIPIPGTTGKTGPVRRPMTTTIRPTPSATTQRVAPPPAGRRGDASSGVLRAPGDTSSSAVLRPSGDRRPPPPLRPTMRPDAPPPLRDPRAIPRPRPVDEPPPE